MNFGDLIKKHETATFRLRVFSHLMDCLRPFMDSDIGVPATLPVEGSSVRHVPKETVEEVFEELGDTCVDIENEIRRLSRMDVVEAQVVPTKKSKTPKKKVETHAPKLPDNGAALRSNHAGDRKRVRSSG